MSALPARRPPFRADHIGSLLRPAALRRAARDRAAGAIDAAALEAVEDAAILGALELQRAVGLEVATDGEFRRGFFWGRFVDRVAGFGLAPARFRFRDDAGATVDFTAPLVTDRVRRRGPIAGDEAAFVARHTALVPKITLPAPSTFHFWRGRGWAEPGTYASAEELFADLARVYRDELAELVRAGARYVQLDEVALAMLCDPAVRALVAADGLDPSALMRLYVDAIAAALAGRPPELVVGLHLCRGNNRGRYLSSGGYEPVAERLFAGASVDHFLLEYDTARAGDFSPLRHLPRGSGVVLGLVSSKLPALEPLDALRARLDEAVRWVAPGRLGVSPQCGFASTAGGNPLTEDDQRRKLARVVEAGALLAR